jgi:hypothetical protein
VSLTKELISEINRANARNSSGPKTRLGKQRSRLNAVKHNLSGQHLILQESEVEAYNRMSSSMLNDLNPKSEPERQIAQKVIDINFRLNRITAIENNLFTFGLTANETDTDQDDRIEIMAAQTRAWTERAGTFDVIGRYEARLSRQLLKYQEEFERLQTVRKDQEFTDRHKSAEEIEQHKFDPASFGPVENSYRILTHLPPPNRSPQPEPRITGDLVTGDVIQNFENNMAA